MKEYEVINMGLYVVEFYADMNTKEPCHNLSETFEDYNDALIAASEYVRQHRHLKYEVRMLSEEEEAAQDGPVRVVPTSAPIVPVYEDDDDGGRTDWAERLMKSLSPTPDCDTDKADFLDTDHRLHAVYFLVMNNPGITKRELRKRLAIVAIDGVIEQLTDLDVIRATRGNNDRWQYAAAKGE